MAANIRNKLLKLPFVTFIINKSLVYSKKTQSGRDSNSYKLESLNILTGSLHKIKSYGRIQ